MIVTSKIKLDMAQQGVQGLVSAVQGDGNTRAVEAELLANGASWIPDADWEAAVTYRKPDGKKGLYNLLDDGSSAIAISGSTATVILAAQMLTEPGTVRAAIVFNNQRLDQLTSFPFLVSVARNQFAGAQQSEDYIRLQWLEDKLSEKIEQLISTEQAVRAGVAAQEATTAAAAAQEQATTAGNAAASANAAASRADTAAAGADTAKENADTAASAANTAAAAAQEKASVAENAASTANTAASRADTAAAGADTAKENADAAASAANTAAAAAQEKATAAGNAAASANAAASRADTAAAGADTAKENADTAASAANTAAAAAQEKASVAENAASTANTAASRADTAAAGADAAKENADAAASAANTSAAAAQAVVDGIVPEVGQLRSDLTGITPDDTAVDGKPWTSKQIVDSLCQPFEGSGNPVQCYPVENYPIGVKVSWEPVQDGSGDPSPDNIRPITGRNSVTVERCGENLLDKARFPIIKTENNIIVDSEITLPAGTYTVCVLSVANGVYADGADVWSTYDSNKHTFTLARQTAIRLSAYWRKGRPEKDENIWLIEGNEWRTYTPYTGSTTDIALQETVYGGGVDAVSGENNRTWRTITLTGEEDSHIYGNLFYIDLFKDGSFVQEKPADATTGKCSHYKYNLYMKDCIGVANDGRSVVYSGISKYPISDDGIQEWKAYLAAQYAAGAPVQICYKLAEPVPFTATGAQPIPALSGANTIYTDADGVVVTGAEDPKHTIAELKNAIISLGGNI